MATRKRFRGATDAVYVAPDQHVAVTRCHLGFCWFPIEQYQVMQVQDGAPLSLTRHDAMGRVTVTASLQMDGVWSHVLDGYNAKGQLEYRTEPFRGGDPMSYSYFQYNDILGRMTRKQVPKQGEDGRGDMVTTYSYSGRTTQISVTGSSGSGTILNLSRTTDSLGRYVETVDAKAGRTRFWYESNGNVAAIEDAKGVITKAAYNAIGQRMSVNDPNQGNWSFAYNALGEVSGQTDARGVVTAMTYDKLGRPVTRSVTLDVTGDAVADVVFDNWTYDPANAKGAPEVAQRTINGSLERSNTQYYDALARPVLSYVAQATTAGTQGFSMRTRYDSYYGRPIGQEFPNGEAVQVLYGIYGHALAEKDPLSGTEYRRLNSVNARSQPLQETFGNGVVLNAQYQHQTGQLTQLHYTKGAANVRKLGYGYDVFGNVKRQSLNDDASREDYAYDELQRMVSAIRSGAASGSISYGYDSVGNLTRKTDFSANTANAYSYTGGSCGGGANAVRSVALAAGGTRTYCYDANGSLISDNAGLALQYDHQGMTVKATRGAQTDHFRYGPDGARTRSWGADGARVYLPGYEHRTDTGETKVYIGDYAVISRTGATRKVDYLLKDRLGSVDAVTDSAGTVTETRGYDAFGKPRSGTWNDLTPPKLGSVAVTPKGFTQHEHLNQLELIHMNGRVFDYALGRFFSVDPIIQFPLNSQSLNPYSYILNNPLSGTDPTGYACDAPLGSRIKSCEVATATETNSAGEVTSSRSAVVPKGTVAAWIANQKNYVAQNGNAASPGQSATGAEGRKGNNQQAAERSPDQRSSTDQLSTGQRVAAGGNALLSGTATAACAYGGGILCPKSLGLGCVAAFTCLALGSDITAEQTTEAVTGRAQTPVLAQGFSAVTGVSPESAEFGQNALFGVTNLWSARSLVLQQIRGPSAAPAVGEMAPPQSLIPLSTAEAIAATAPERVVAGYSLWGNAGRVGNTYNVNVLGLYASPQSQGLGALLKLLRAEASASGATRIQINGFAIINKGFSGMSPKAAARFGLEIKHVDDSTIILSGAVK